MLQLSGHRSPRRMLVGTALLCILLLAACESDSQDGPGPAATPGPIVEPGPDGPAGGDRIAGSGSIVSESREVDEFDRLVFSSQGTVIVTPTGTAALTIEADDNLHQYLTAQTSGGVLTISTSEGVDIEPSQTIIFRVDVVELSSLELAGAGTVAAEMWDAPDVGVILSGAGDIIIDGLRAEELTVDLGGVGSVSVIGGVEHQQVTATGVGDYEGAELASRTAEVTADSTGTVTVWVTDELSVSGSGEIAYYGSPAVEASGTVTVTPLGSKEAP